MRAWERALVLPVTAFVISRVMVLAAAGLATWIHPGLTISQVLDGWDGGWYLKIATQGYPATLASAAGGGAWGFFPGLPAVLHGVVVATGISYTHAGEIVGVGFGLTAVLAVWLAVRQALGAAAADLTAVLLCFFPAAYVLSMPYSEGLFVTVAALCIYFLGRRAWLLAGLTASIATLSRDPGIVLVGTCVVVGVVEIVSKRTWRPIAAILTAPIGFLLSTLYEWHGVGSPVALFMRRPTGDRGSSGSASPSGTFGCSSPRRVRGPRPTPSSEACRCCLSSSPSASWCGLRYATTASRSPGGCTRAGAWRSRSPPLGRQRAPLRHGGLPPTRHRRGAPAATLRDGCGGWIGDAAGGAGGGRLHNHRDLADGPVCSLTDPDGRRGLAATRARAPARRRTSRVPPGALPGRAPVTLRKSRFDFPVL